MINNLYGTTTCARMIGKKFPILEPSIISLSSSYSVAGSTTLITLYGNNYRDYSIIRFGNKDVESIFISSSYLSFYVPYNFKSGTYTIQVNNDGIFSNVVDFTIDESVGFWDLIEENNSISNTNEGDVDMGNSSVNAKYFHSWSSPGVLFVKDNYIYLPIFTSIADYSNFYKNPSSGVTFISGLGSISVLDESNIVEGIVNQTFIIFPGYKFILVDNTFSTILSVENLTNSPVACNPVSSSSTTSLKSSKLYFYQNKEWNELKQ
jgi:hypothetical protein